MPTTKKEDFYFGLMMCLGMVVFMTFYNLYTNDLIGTISLKVMFLQFILCFIIAFPLQLLIVGPLVRYLFVKFVKGTRIAVSLS
ncbi:hypothetical protein AM598_15680 [Paenibacillus polymyxa]|nr:hypothetical protein AM598_15680 [Paenibacillus polymyxa]